MRAARVGEPLVEPKGDEVNYAGGVLTGTEGGGDNA